MKYLETCVKYLENVFQSRCYDTIWINIIIIDLTKYELFTFIKIYKHEMYNLHKLYYQVCASAMQLHARN